MKKLLLVCFFSLSAAALMALDPPATVKYFEKVELDGALRFVGRYPVEAARLADIPAYGLAYDKAGSLTGIIYYKRGLPAADEAFGAARIVISQDGDFETRTFQSSKGLVIENRLGIASIRIKKNAQGFPVNLFQYDRFGNLRNDESGVPAYAYLPDASGLRKRTLRFDPMGTRVPDKAGVWETAYTYDPSGKRIAAVYLDATGQPLVARNGYTEVRWAWDEAGNLAEEARFDADGQPTGGLSGIARVTWKYDNRGRPLEKRNLDVDGKLWPDNSGVALYRWEYNDRLHWTKEYHNDRDGQLTLDDRGVAVVKDVWYPQTNEREIKTFGLEINPAFETLKPIQKEEEDRYLLVANDWGAAVTRTTYDDDGNDLETKYFGPTLQLVPDADGIPLYRRTFNGAGQVLTVRCFSNFDQPAVNRQGLATIIYEYDQLSRLVRKTNLGLRDSLKEDTNGVATYVYKYNDRGMAIEQTNLGTFAQIKEDRVGVGIYRWAYDKFGNLTEEAHYGIDEKPTEDSSGVYLYKWRYDRPGERLLSQKFDKGGALLGGTHTYFP